MSAPDELGRAAAIGAGWLTASYGALQLVRLVGGVILARLLGPEALGVFAMSLVVVGFADVLKDMGFRVALVQARELGERHLSSLFWLSVASGLLLAAGVAGVGGAIGRAYDEPRVAPILSLLALRFALDGPAVVPSALLQRSLRFRQLAVVEVTASVAALAISIALAALGFGVWSLVAQVLALALYTSVGLAFVASWRPRLLFEWRSIRELWGVAGPSFGFSAINYWARNADNLLIGRFLGATALGLYSRAYQVLLVPVQIGAGVIGRTLFPAMALVQDDPPRLRRGYLRAARLSAVCLFPLMAATSVLAEPLVLLALGPAWESMIPMVRVFGVVGLVQSQVVLNGSLYLATGRTDRQLRVGGAVAVLGVIGIAVGLRWGATGVALCYSAVALLVALPNIYFAITTVGLRMGEVLRNLQPQLLASAGTAVALSAVEFWLHQRAPFLRLVVATGVGTVVYCALLTVMRVGVMGELRAIVESVKRSG